VKVLWSEDAAGDLKHLLAFIAQSSPKGAASVASRIEATLTQVSQFPNAGRLDPETGCRERLVGRYPILLVYLVHPDVVEIIALFHTSRDPAAKRKPA
jgi:toxin ParE1/3/4